MATKTFGASLRADEAAATRAALEQIRKQLAAAGTDLGASAEVFAMKPRTVAAARGLLWRLLTAAIDERQAMLGTILARLDTSLPWILKGSGLTPGHFGFSTVPELARYLVASLAGMQTGARTLAEFNRNIEGWRWNFAGRVLFERIVKYHPGLHDFFQSVARDLFGRVAGDARNGMLLLVDGRGKGRRVTATFGKTRKVVEFELQGADLVTRAYTDFGFIAPNAEDFWAVLPIEIKLPSALAGVAQQFSEFVPRMQEASKIIAHVAEADGTVRPLEILPEKLVLLQHEHGQIAVSPLTAKQGQEVLKLGPVSGADIGSVVDFRPATSATYDLLYYKVKVLVVRDWLVEIVRAITEPPTR